MKAIQLTMLLSAAALSAFAQQWEVGGGAGASFVPGKSITSTQGSATTGFKPGVAFGAYVGQNLYPHISGELHYGFMQSNLRLQSGGTEASFSGVAHVVHYDVVLRTNRQDSRKQYYAIVGGGMKLFSGTGKETAYQPLSQYAYLTRTRSIKPMVSVGAGVKYRIGERLVLRTEIRDYMTMFPKDLIAPAPGAKFGGLLHDLVPMVTIAYEY